MYADLHTHTIASDGTFTPEELAHAAHGLGIRVLAVADHDTTASVPPMTEICAALGIRFIPAVELSCSGPIGECHMLGYKIDIHNSLLKQGLAEYSENRRTRNARIVERLNALGLEMTMTDVETAAPPGANIGRPHIAQAMVNRRYVRDTQTAFLKYLGDNGPAFVPRPEPTPEQAIQMIHDAGGIAVLAHPKFLNLRDHQTYETQFNALKRAGLDGIEAYYSQNTQAETERFVRLAAKYDLIVSGGSDFHGDVKPDVPLGIVWVGKKLPISKLPDVFLVD